jgi:hypothetical protein
MKKIILIILCASLIFSAYSCNSDENGGANNATTYTETNLANILRSLRENGMTSWWDILAVYNAGEDPMQYKGYDEVIKSLEEGNTTLSRASYVIVTNISIIIGADEGYYEYYREYISALKNTLENPGSGNINDYIFAYFALKTSASNGEFDKAPVRAYLESLQKADGGFALSGDTGDADVTAFAVGALVLMYDIPELQGSFDLPLYSTLNRAVTFLNENINEDGTYSSWGNANANSTASALSAMMSFGNEGEEIGQIQEGLSLFETGGGYSFLQGDGRDNLATAQGAIALGDLRSGRNAWVNLYLDALDVFDDYEYYDE